MPLNSPPGSRFLRHFHKKHSQGLCSRESDPGYRNLPGAQRRRNTGNRDTCFKKHLCPKRERVLEEWLLPLKFIFLGACE